jgi:hypothetical protein
MCCVVLLIGGGRRLRSSMLIVRSRRVSMKRIRSGWRSLRRFCRSVVIGKCGIYDMVFDSALRHKSRCLLEDFLYVQLEIWNLVCTRHSVSV